MIVFRPCVLIACIWSVVSCGEAPDRDHVGAGTAQSARPSPDVRSDSLIVYKTATCGCCEGWVEHMRKAGFAVAVHDVADVNPVKSQYAIPQDLLSCHTALIGGYVVEGHVPANDVRRLLRERPEVRGLAVAGMPAWSPGMEIEGVDPHSYDVIAYDGAGRRSTFARH